MKFENGMPSPGGKKYGNNNNTVMQRRRGGVVKSTFVCSGGTHEAPYFAESAEGDSTKTRAARRKALLDAAAATH